MVVDFKFYFIQIRSRVWLVVLSFFFNRLIWRLRKGTTSVREELEEDGGQIWVCGRPCVRAGLEEVGGLIWEEDVIDGEWDVVGGLCGCGGREWLGWRVKVCLVVGRFSMGGRLCLGWCSEIRLEEEKMKALIYVQHVAEGRGKEQLWIGEWGKNVWERESCGKKRNRLPDRCGVVVSVVNGFRVRIFLCCLFQKCKIAPFCESVGNSY